MPSAPRFAMIDRERQRGAEPTVLRLTEIVLDCRDPVAQASFWAAALGYHIVRSEDGQVEIAPWPQEPPDLAQQIARTPGAPTLVFVAVPEGKEVKNRLHLDLRPTG